jgi:hypothetical protein
MHDDCVCALALAVFGLGPNMQPFASSRIKRTGDILDAEVMPQSGEEDFGRVRAGWEDRDIFR